MTTSALMMIAREDDIPTQMATHSNSFLASTRGLWLAAVVAPFPLWHHQNRLFLPRSTEKPAASATTSAIPKRFSRILISVPTFLFEEPLCIARCSTDTACPLHPIRC